MTRRRILLACLMATLAIGGRAKGQTSYATGSGTWTGSIWTPAAPGSSSTVYIGSTASKAAKSATVTLPQNESAASLYLGNGSSTSGTLNLGGHTLTISGTLTIGSANGGSGQIQETIAGSSFTAGTLSIYGAAGNGAPNNSLSFGANDGVSTLKLSDAATVTTSATGNVTQGVTVGTGSTLNLGANLGSGSLGTVDVQDTGSILNVGSHNITATTLDLGWSGTSAVTVSRSTSSDLNVTTLNVGNGTSFNVNSGDSIKTFNLDGIGSKSTLNGDVGTLNLTNGASAATTTTGGATTAVAVETGSSLTLGGNLSLSGTLDVRDSNSSINLGPGSVSAKTVDLGWNGTSAVTANAGTGTLTATTLNVGNGTSFAINKGDSITTFNLSGGSSTLTGNVGTLNLTNGAVATTSGSGGPTTAASVASGSTLSLGGNLTLTGALNVQDSGSTLNLGGHSLTVGTLELGSAGSSPVNFSRGGSGGTLTATNLDLGNGQSIVLHATDSIKNLNIDGPATVTGGTISGKIDVAGAFTVQEAGKTGLMLNNTSSSALTFASGGTMTLDFTAHESWAFAWEDVVNSKGKITKDWVSTIDAMIESKQILIAGLANASDVKVVDMKINGVEYTAVEFAPEPSSLWLTCVVGGGALLGVAIRRRRGR